MIKDTKESKPASEPYAGDPGLLEETARHLYIELSRGRMRGYDPKAIAERAFQEALAFCNEANAIREGKEIRVQELDEKPLFAVVDLWDMSKDKGEPKRDENNRIVREVLPVDRCSFAPNLPDGHPINQRYYPNALKAGRLCDVNGRDAQGRNLLEALAASN